MTDREKLLALLTEFGVSPSPSEHPEDEHGVTLEAYVGGVAGYSGFLCTFEFTADGEFKNVGVWE
ncbi:hypothetical protein AB0N28_03600 [Streptomyces sp. NPDC051130]|uniref:hypothetical protein n=1 Tax=Streptomyces sp. NPDC051130 TaxID=3157223 RepID=UPI0034424AAD